MDSGWWAVVVAAIAAVFAAWQAWEARKARADARAASEAAGEHESAALAAARDAAGAASRGAAAQERIAEVVEQSSTDKRTWGFRYHGGEDWQIYNASETIIDARLIPHDREQVLQVSEVAQTSHQLNPSAGITVFWPNWDRSLPVVARVRVWWETDDGKARSETVTLNRGGVVPWPHRRT